MYEHRRGGDAKMLIPVKRVKIERSFPEIRGGAFFFAQTLPVVVTIPPPASFEVPLIARRHDVSFKDKRRGVEW